MQEYSAAGGSVDHALVRGAERRPANIQNERTSELNTLLRNTCQMVVAPSMAHSSVTSKHTACMYSILLGKDVSISVHDFISDLACVKCCTCAKSSCPHTCCLSAIRCTTLLVGLVDAPLAGRHFGPSVQLLGVQPTKKQHIHHARK